jgi:hypothetical protein
VNARRDLDVRNATRQPSPRPSRPAVRWKQAVAPGCRVSRRAVKPRLAPSATGTRRCRVSLNRWYANPFRRVAHDTAEARSKRWTAEGACCVQRREPGRWAMLDTRPCCGMQYAASRHRSAVEREEGERIWVGRWEMLRYIPRYPHPPTPPCAGQTPALVVTPATPLPLAAIHTGAYDSTRRDSICMLAPKRQVPVCALISALPSGASPSHICTGIGSATQLCASR